jgi:hypothetical protein
MQSRCKKERFCARRPVFYTLSFFCLKIKLKPGTFPENLNKLQPVWILTSKSEAGFLRKITILHFFFNFWRTCRSALVNYPLANFSIFFTRSVSVISYIYSSP